MNREFKIPLYIRATFVLLCIGLISLLVWVASGILVPILMALLFAILLRPVVCFFNRRLHFPHVIAVIVSVALFVLVIAGIVFFVSWKIGDIANDVDSIKEHLNTHYHNLRHWVKQQFNISYSQQEEYIQKARRDGLPGTAAIGQTMSSFTDVLMNMVLIPLYIFLFLLYRNLFLQFLTKLVRPEHQHRLRDVLANIKSAIQSYLVGILIEVCIVSTLTSIGFMIIGVKYAVLLGVITGVLNLIPYIGILIAGALSIVATLTTSADLSIIFGVIIVNSVVQLLDNNILVPMIVSSKVKINAFISIVAIIIGGALAGVAGMFLAIPLTAILKVIFDRVDVLEPWGFLMGDDLPKTYDWGRLKLPSYGADIKEPDMTEPPATEEEKKPE